ncbi:hypothetical protein PFAG_02210 [Plasmodium falciparum Santa Lucia]|uniref:Schizont-infected cell agglutination C-terminal domain-containing protein n=1 Tax=Plasmodium falciparum Santa Lucia TaxID=478859 RepID=W7FK85_PLAFA|nr:hypothetical protein PFAG_02210 [Plasmodium falciparum Santa Lucia]
MAIISSIPNYREGLIPSLYNLRFSLFRDRVNAYTISKIKKLKKSRNYKRLCRYLNYKLDDIKDVFMLNNVLGIPRTARMGLWENVMENKLKDIIEENSHNKCRRIYPYFQRIQRRRRKALENFCEDKEKKQEELKNVKFDMKKCLEFNEWVKESENKIFKLFKNNITERDKRKKAYIISDKCKLGNLNTLFGQMDCSDKIDRHFPYIFLEGNPVYPSEKDDDKNIKDPEEGKDEEEEEEDGEVTINIRSNGEKGFPFVNNTPVLEGIEGSGFDLDFETYDISPPSLNSSEIAKLFEFNSESHVEHMNIVSSRSPNIVNIEFSDVPLTAAHMTSSITAKNISSYLYVPLGVLFIIISFIWFFLNRTKHLNMLIKEKEKVKTENIVPSEAYVKLDDLEVMKLLISLKGDKYNMSQRQKIIWRKWIAKHPYKINEEIINIWLNRLSDEIDKNGIISDEAIKKFLSLEKDISDKDFLKYRRKKLEVILWVKIYMSVLEEEKNEELEKSKESFLNTCTDELKKEEPSEENERMIIIADEMKKGFLIETIRMMNKQSDIWYRWVERHAHMLEKWKEEEWFLRLKESWRDEEEEYMKRAYKELLISLRGDKYHMSQRQKIIWRKWIAKHPFRVREFVIDKWFNQLFEELEKEGIISDEAIRNFLSQYEEAYDEEKIQEFIKYKKKVLVVILWIKIYMSMLEEYVKEEDIESEKLFIDTSLEELKKKKEIEEEVLEDLKKDIYESDEMKEIEKYKGEDWFKQMQQDWIRRDYKFVSSYNLESDDEEQFHEFVKKPTVEIQKDLLKEQWKNIELKWIEEDNYDEYRDWLRIAIDKKNLKTDEINEDINRMIELNMLEDYSNDLYDKKKIKWKTIIEIHMEVLNDCKNDEWEMNKGDFLDICLEEFGTMENKEYSHIINNMLMVGELEYKHLNMDVIERQNDLWNKWIEGHRYMLEKWKKEKWFIVLKENWKNEEHKYMRKAYLELLMSLREDVKNPLLQRQKIIWRKWIAKNLYHIESNVIKKWFDTLLEEIERKGVIELDGCINLIEMEENEEYLEYLKEYRKKKLICIIWIKIYMMIIEENKKEEYLECKEIFLDTCVDELREQEILEGNELYMDDMKTSILLNDQKEEIEKLKMKKWYKDLKKEWIIEENRYFRSIINEEDDEEYKNMISKPLRDVEKKISKKHWEDIQLKWIDEDNERDWLKIARNENEEIKYLYINENVSKKKKKVPFYIDDYRKKGRSNKNKIYRRKREKCNVKLNENNTMNKEMENWENRMEFLKICVDLLKKRTFYYINIWEKNKAFYDETNEIMKQLEEKIFERQKILWYNKEDMNKMSSKKWGNEEWFIILKNDWNEEKTCYLNGIQYEYNINNLIEEEKKYLYLKKEKIIWKEWLLKNFKNIEECDNEDWFNNLMETYKIDEICTINMNGEIHSLGLENTLKRNFLKNIIWIDIFMGVLNACEEEEELEEHKHKNMLESKVEDNDKLFYEKNEDYINKNEMENYINDIQENEGNQMDIPDWFDAYQSDEMSGKQKSIQKDEQWFIKELEEGGIKSDVLQENYTIYNNKLIEQKMNILRESYIRN